MYNISSDPDTEKVLEKYPVFQEFMDHCHGSGIDYQWSAIEKKTEISLYNSFHVMNEAGMYCAVCDFIVHIPKDNMLNFTVKCQTNRYYWLKNLLGEYLPDTIHFALSDAIKTLNTGMPYKDGFRKVEKYELTPVRK